ncbi:actin cortical patch SUR7/pH-response regulator pali [Cercophora scortea]|uniref:Actin cortical patch SUR7/pH-response regulator pali n=1 Tax=Cercophora scortea TaxID=314031 RepID=A0AAE0J2X5_9PEZI|nr:actin cortical patch SUR7/pH-response regulator pali [Cercophora scortea]
MKQLSIGIPIVASLAAFVLVLLALLAGSRPGFMEDFDIVTFNTSALGKNLLSTATDDNKPTSTTDGLCDGLGGALGRLCSSATAEAETIESEIVSAIDDIGNTIADKLADTLGIHEFYSVHALAICEGSFTPNATAPSPDRNVTNCTMGLSDGYNVSGIFDHQLQVGPFELTLADLGFTDDIQNAFDTLNQVTKAFAIILIISVALTGLALVASLASLFLIPRKERAALLSNVVISLIATLMLIASALVVTIGSRVVVSKVNDLGDDVGLSATAGYRYTIFTWVAVGLMMVSFAYWLQQLMEFRRNSRSGMNGHRKHARDSEESGHFYGETREKRDRSSAMDRIPFRQGRRT